MYETLQTLADGSKADGSFFFGQIIWAGVYQYCLLRVLMTVVAVAAEANNTYCEQSLSPAFAHIWVC